MRTFELRIYTLASAEAVNAYLTVYYPNHQVSMPRLFGVTVHGYWSPIGADDFQVYVLMSYPQGVDPGEVRHAYMADPESAQNMPGFDPAVIVSVSSTFLAPAAKSTLA